MAAMHNNRFVKRLRHRGLLCLALLISFCAPNASFAASVAATATSLGAPQTQATTAQAAAPTGPSLKFLLAPVKLDAGLMIGQRGALTLSAEYDIWHGIHAGVFLYFGRDLYLFAPQKYTYKLEAATNVYLRTMARFGYSFAPRKSINFGANILLGPETLFLHEIQRFPSTTLRAEHESTSTIFASALLLQTRWLPWQNYGMNFLLYWPLPSSALQLVDVENLAIGFGLSYRF